MYVVCCGLPAIEPIECVVIIYWFSLVIIAVLAFGCVDCWFILVQLLLVSCIVEQLECLLRCFFSIACPVLNPPLSALVHCFRRSSVRFRRVVVAVIASSCIGQFSVPDIVIYAAIPTTATMPTTRFLPTSSSLLDSRILQRAHLTDTEKCVHSKLCAVTR